MTRKHGTPPPDFTHAKRPSGKKWKEFDAHGLAVALRAREAYVFQRYQIRVVSALEVAKLPDCDDLGLQWHVSVTNDGKWRPTQAEVDRALAAFGMIGAEEDNHHPGLARHFWMPVDPAHRVECECKADEAIVVEPDGYTWSNDKEKCRGCEQALIFADRPCPIHAANEERTG